MGPACASALASLDDSLALLSESLGELKAAKPVDIAEVIQQLKIASECARTVRELIWSELPEAAWQNRQELDALIDEIQKVLDARTLEQLRSRLLALATELERGSMVHRRTHRLNELNQLRDQAVNELRSQAGLKGALPTLPGPEAGQWIEWACGLQDPQDAESLETLRNGFVHLDDFVANLEPNMWIAASPALEIPPDPKQSTAKTQPEQFRRETSGFEEPVVSAGPNLAMRFGSGSSETPAEAPVRADALASLDGSLALLRESLGKLKAAKSGDIAGVIEQFTMAAESARIVRESVWSELPEAAWQSRQELDALMEEIQKRVEARALEQLCSRLLALATELESGTIVHRRAHRLNELNQLRDQAINELRSQAGPEGVPQALPGPESNQWIEWACSLQEPQDAESLQTLRNGFASLDEFVANLEPTMWKAAASPTPETLPEPEGSATKKQPEQSRQETSGFEGRFEGGAVSPGPTRVELEAARPSGGRDEPRFPNPVDELSVPALESNTLTPNDVTPPRTEEDLQRIQEQERALLASMMGLVTDPVRHFEPPSTAEAFRESSAAAATLVSDPVRHFEPPVEHPFTAEVFREPSAAAATLVSDPVARFNRPVGRPFTAEVVHETIVAPPGLVGDPDDHFDYPVERSFRAKDFGEMIASAAIISKVRTAIEGPWSGKQRMLLAIAAMLVLAAMGAMLWRSGAISWRSDSNHASTAPVTAIEKQPPNLTESKPEDKSQDQAALSTDSTTQASSPRIQPEKQPKPQEQSVAAKPVSKAPPAKQANEVHDAVLQPPAPTPRNIAMVKKEEAPPGGVTEAPGAGTGGVPSGVASSVMNLVKNIPVAEPKLAAQKVRVSSGVAQGLLVRQVTPRYPQSARQAHIEGTVVLQVVIGKDGTVQSLHVLSGHPMLTQAAMDAVRQWRYKPYYLDGAPVEADTQINVNFNLSGQ